MISVTGNNKNQQQNKIITLRMRERKSDPVMSIQCTYTTVDLFVSTALFAEKGLIKSFQIFAQVLLLQRESVSLSNDTSKAFAVGLGDSVFV